MPQDLAIGIVRGWIQAGGENKRISRTELEKAIAERGLRSDAAETPQATLIIHGWDRRYFDVPPTIELDWTRFFDFESRSTPNQEVWMDALIPELKRAKSQLAGIAGANFVEFRGKLPLSALLVVGRTFPEAGGFRLRVEQPTGGETHLWRSDAPTSPFELTVSETPIEGPGKDLLVSVSLTGDASADVRKLLSEERRFKLWVALKPASGASSTSVKSAGEGTTIALEVKELLRQFRLRSGAEKIGLILYCPASVALFIGQRLNALGEVVAYERRAAGGYQEAVVIHTG